MYPALVLTAHLLGLLRVCICSTIEAFLIAWSFVYVNSQTTALGLKWHTIGSKTVSALQFLFLNPYPTDPRVVKCIASPI